MQSKTIRNPSRLSGERIVSPHRGCIDVLDPPVDNTMP
jgi:hypothetical protein